MVNNSPVAGTLYHRPGSPPRGDALLPMGRLRGAHPDLHAHHAAKHTAYPEALEQAVPPLGCTWADVVFLSPVHPRPLFDALGRAGTPATWLEPWTIDACHLDPSRTVIRLMRHGREGHHPDPPDEHDWLPFTTATLRAVNRITVDAVDRLEALEPGDPWLPWVDVPHVLHRGPIPWSHFDRG